MSGEQNKAFTKLLAAVLLLAVIAGSVTLYRVSIKRDGLRLSIDEMREEGAELTRRTLVQKETLRRGREAEQRVLSIMRICRDAKDIPRFKGKELIVQQTGQGDWFVHVPEGEHSMVIQASWTVETNAQVAEIESLPEPIEPGSREWRVPLKPNSGYHFHLTGYSFDVEPISWELTSNRDGFKDRIESLNLPAFEIGAGSSWGVNGAIRLPVEIGTRSNPAQPIADTTGRMSQFRATKSGPVGQKTLSVKFLASIETLGKVDSLE